MQCVYPLGVADGAKLIVRRQASEVSLKRKRKKKQKQRESEVRFVSQLSSDIFIEEVPRVASQETNSSLYETDQTAENVQ